MCGEYRAYAYSANCRGPRRMGSRKETSDIWNGWLARSKDTLFLTPRREYYTVS